MCVSSRTSMISANFQRLSQVLKKFLPLRADNAHLTNRFLKKSPSRCISSCQQHIKLDQSSQQNTHSRTARWVLLIESQRIAVARTYARASDQSEFEKILILYL